MEWIDVKVKMPKTRGRWSIDDVLVLCKYSYEIGRTCDGKWVNMENKPIEATHWMPLPPPKKFINTEDELVGR